MTDHKNASPDYQRAKELRRRSPMAQKLVWNQLSLIQKQKDLKFRQEYPLHPYIADFVCLKAKLIIELDGMSHDTRESYDEQRTKFLEEQGFTVIRFANDEVFKNLTGVVMTIINKAESLIAEKSGESITDRPLP